MLPLPYRLQDSGSRMLSRRIVQVRPATPILSITFDDVLANATRAGLDILEQQGVSGTWYVAPGLLDSESNNGPIASAADIRRLVDAGQDIGAHTYSHRRVTTLSIAEILAEEQQCAERLGEITGAAHARHFAYPEGFVSIAAKRLLSQRYETLRGIRPGVMHGRTDANLLAGTALYGDDSRLSTLRSVLEELGKLDGWLILYTHDIRDDPSPYGATPGLLAGTLRIAREQGIEILSVSKAWRKIQAAA